MNNITLYSTHCPKCLVLEKKLNSKNLSYDLVEDVGEMLNLGFKQAPILKVDNKYMNFVEANNWINGLEG